MPTRVQRYLEESGPPSLFLRFNEACFKFTSSLLLLGGLTAAGWAWGELQGPGQPLLLAQLSPTWLLSAVMCVGVALTVTAGLGLCAVTTRSISLMNLHLVVLSFLLSAQLCIIVSVTTKGSSSDGGLAIDDPQSLHNIQQLPIPDWDTTVVKTVVTSVGVGLQVVSLLVACVLQSAYTQIDEAAQDLAEEVSARRPLLPSSLPQRAAAPSRNVEDPEALEWRTRMHERYGLDTRQFTYDPSGTSARQDSAPQLGRSSANQRNGSSCAVM